MNVGMNGGKADFEAVGDFGYAAFRMGLRKIDEFGMSRILDHGKHGFIVVSANRREIHSSKKDNDLTGEYERWCKENGLDARDVSIMDKWLKRRNEIEDGKLAAELKKSKYAYSPVYGGCHGTDDVADSFGPSYIVYCHEKKIREKRLDFGELHDFARYLAGKYKQDGVYIQGPNGAPVYVDAKGNNGNHALSTPPRSFTADIQFGSMYASRGPSDYVDRMRRRQAGEVFVYG